MEIFRNGELIGYNHYFFNQNGSETIFTNQIKFVFKLLAATVFQLEHCTHGTTFTPRTSPLSRAMDTTVSTIPLISVTTKCQAHLNPNQQAFT